MQWTLLGFVELWRCCASWRMFEMLGRIVRPPERRLEECLLSLLSWVLL